jgi:hypothetical protein
MTFKVFWKAKLVTVLELTQSPWFTTTTTTKSSTTSLAMFQLPSMYRSSILGTNWFFHILHIFDCSAYEGEVSKWLNFNCFIVALYM